MKHLVTNKPHPTNCSGCPQCSELACAILANPRNPVLTEAMSHPRLRAVGEFALRAAAAAEENASLDGWAVGLAKLRTGGGNCGGGNCNCHTQPAAEVERADETELLRAMSEFRQEFYRTAAESRAAAEQPATTPVYSSPPDPYAAALKARRESEQ